LMADDNNHRSFRGADAASRAASGTPAGSDPLAELARLIGQNDPFGEYSRADERRPSNVRQGSPAPVQPAPVASAPMFGAPDFGRQTFGSAPLAGQNDLYHVEQGNNAYEPPGQYAENQYAQTYGVPGYGVPGYPPERDAGYDDGRGQGAYDPQQPGAVDDDYYDDAPPNRRRIGILAIAGIFALAVIGTAGAFGYRAIFGSSGSSGPPPVIKADSTPSKIVPAASSKDASASKLIGDRIGDRGQEKLVSREEQPVSISTIAAGDSQSMGSGVVGSEPKKIRTIAIHPDQQGAAAAAPAPQPQTDTAEPSVQPRVTNITPRVTTTAPAPAPLPRVAMPDPAPSRPSPAAPAPVRAATPSAPAPAANAPLSLNPNASAPSAARSAAVAPPSAPAAASGGAIYAVQVSAQRSEAEAEAAYRSLQGKFPGQLGNRQPVIRRVDLGAKGIFYRALVGPFGSSGEANEMCSALKAAGGQCIVQRN
jgi:hypothetical protein